MATWLSNLQQGIVPLDETSQYPNGTVIVREEDPWHENAEMYFILQGEFTVYLSGIPVRTLVEGDHFGELSLFTKSPRSASIVCTSASNLVIKLPYTKFLTLINKFPEFSTCLKTNARNNYVAI